VPPVAATAFEYEVPCVPDARLDVVIARVAGATTNEKATDLVCAGLPASVTVTVKPSVPLVFGVPEIRPVVEARLSPAGRLPAPMDQE
jgi:hypothetical protein